jgi:hypothetical protein
MQEAAVAALEDGPDSLESDPPAAVAAPALADVDSALDAAPLSPDNTAAPVGGSAALARSSTTSSDPSTFDTIPFDFLEAGISLGDRPMVPREDVASAASSGSIVGQEGGGHDRDSLDARILFLEYLFSIYSKRGLSFM